jgi:hypothetical protein
MDNLYLLFFTHFFLYTKKFGIAGLGYDLGKWGNRVMTGRGDNLLLIN